MKPSWVYFVRPIGAEGPVKIGCSEVPPGRLSHLMAWSPVPLEIVATLPGDNELERRFHHRFLHLHSHREWFRSSPEITATIDAIRDQTFDVAGLPPAKRLPPGVMRTAETARAIGYSVSLDAMRRRGVPIPREVAMAAGWHRDPEKLVRCRAVVAAFVEAQRAKSA